MRHFLYTSGLGPKSVQSAEEGLHRRLYRSGLGPMSVQSVKSALGPLLHIPPHFGPMLEIKVTSSCLKNQRRGVTISLWTGEQGQPTLSFRSFFYFD